MIINQILIDENHDNADKQEDDAPEMSEWEKRLEGSKIKLKDNNEHQR